jgi:hypothetical protein
LRVPTPTANWEQNVSTCRCRGRVLTDVEVVLADGGEAIADIAVLGHQCALLGPVASAPTVWRTLAELSAARLAKVDEARARVRRHVWSQLPGGVPASKVADSDLGDVVVLDVDATIVVAHSEKEAAAPTRATSGFIRSGCGVTTPPNCWPPSCAQVMPGPTRPLITSTCSRQRSPRSLEPIAGTCWFVLMAPGLPMDC